MKKLLTGDESPLSRLPRGANNTEPKRAEKPASAPKSSEPKKPLFSTKPKVTKPKAEAKPKQQETTTETGYFKNKFLPTFWTIASVISMLVNIGVVIALVIALQLLGGTKAALSFAQGQANGLLGGLYNNFVKMDAASIKTTIPINQTIPVRFSLSVSGPTDVTLSKDVVITGALVTVNTGGLNINNARANIVLPAGTVLPVTIQNLVVPVDQQVPVVFDVPVDIPLKATELHDPFVGLQKVVEPYYCLLQPNTVVDGVNVCATAAPIFPVTP
ncbi:MAG: hypothetical protein IPP66_22960 [Anaerolineales bacterium]|nr:hypothetical protein [Anaerolineales bacterium]